MHEQRDPEVIVRLGGWLFHHRTWLPLPLAVVLAVVHVGERPVSPTLIAAGVSIVALGELVRLWAVRHIGVISRTRSDRLGPVVTTGPFRLARNPLYVGNIAVWVGFALSARLLWMAPLIVAILGFEYHAIVRWEERLLESRRGDEYRAYATSVPRWIPALGAPSGPAWRGSARRGPAGPFSWRETLFSERGTFVAIAVGYVLLWLKHRL